MQFNSAALRQFHSTSDRSYNVAMPAEKITVPEDKLKALMRALLDTPPTTAKTILRPKKTPKKK
jgi:hypothetical protein